MTRVERLIVNYIISQTMSEAALGKQLEALGEV
jgi:hypothetical protein